MEAVSWLIKREYFLTHPLLDCHDVEFTEWGEHRGKNNIEMHLNKLKEAFQSSSYKYEAKSLH